MVTRPLSSQNNYLLLLVFKSLERFKTMWMWHLGTGTSGGLGSAGVIVKLEDLRGLFQTEQFHDSMGCWSCSAVPSMGGQVLPVPGCCGSRDTAGKSAEAAGSPMRLQVAPCLPRGLARGEEQMRDLVLL